jgi:hypothetical protein
LTPEKGSQQTLTLLLHPAAGVAVVAVAAGRCMAAAATSAAAALMHCGWRADRLSPATTTFSLLARTFYDLAEKYKNNNKDLFTTLSACRSNDRAMDAKAAGAAWRRACA